LITLQLEWSNIYIGNELSVVLCFIYIYVLCTVRFNFFTWNLWTSNSQPAAYGLIDTNLICCKTLLLWGPSWSYGSRICNYQCNQCLSPLTLWVLIPLMARCTRYNITICEMFYSLFNKDYFKTQMIKNSLWKYIVRSLKSTKWKYTVWSFNIALKHLIIFS
jgi:hypothetical protein